MKDKDDLNPKSNIESVKGNFKRSVTEIRQHVMNVQDLIDDKK
jgi:hypothetical protein